MNEDLFLDIFDGWHSNNLNIGTPSIDGEIFCGERWVCKLITKYLYSPLVADSELKSSTIELDNGINFSHFLKVSIGAVSLEQEHKFKQRIDNYIKEELNILHDGYQES